MTNRPAILFDLDDTLLDFAWAERKSLRSCLRGFGLTPTEEMLSRYSEINRRQWELLEEGKQTREETLTRRFELLFAEYGLRIDGAEACARYENGLAESGHRFMPGAEALLDTLHGRYALYIVSNGLTRVQNARLASAGIAPLFEGIFLSEELGANKPSPAFFEKSVDLIPGFDRRRAILVGDSLSSDIRGARDAGILSCWYNARARSPRADIVPDYTITGLDELPPLLERLWPASRC